MVEQTDSAAPSQADGLDVGRIVALTFKVYFRNFVPFTLITLLVSFPQLLWTYSVLDDLTIDDVLYGSDALTAYNWGTVGLALLLQPIATGAVMFGVFRFLKTGRMASVGDSLLVGFAKLFPVLGVAVVTGLAVAGGMVLLVVPGVMIAIAVFVAVPAAVAEQRGVMDAIQYSRALTSGQRWRIFGVVGIIIAIQIGVYVLLVVFAIMGGALRDPILITKVSMAASFVTVPFFSALNSVSPALVYHDLKVMKEGVDAEALEAIFD